MTFSKILPRQRQSREVWPDRWEKPSGYFDTHPLGDIVRGVIFSSALWGLLAIGIYTVYAMVLGVH